MGTSQEDEEGEATARCIRALVWPPSAPQHRPLAAMQLDDLRQLLAQNPTRLQLRFRGITDEGARALSLNSCLTLLDLSWNRVGAEAMAAVEARLEQNKQAQRQRRNELALCMRLLAGEALRYDSDSLWQRAPGDMRRLLMPLVCVVWARTKRVGSDEEAVAACWKRMMAQVKKL